MAEHTLIEWARHPVTHLGATWNIVTGCDVVSPGCTNCYAMKLAGSRLKHHPSRHGLTRDSKAGPVWNGIVRFNEQWLTQPLRWKQPHGIFVAAHGDLFSEGVSDEQLDRIFAVMALCPQHIFYVLTKRPERMRDYIGAIVDTYHSSPDSMDERFGEICVDLTNSPCASGSFEDRGWPLKNVWLGVSVEDQKRADERIPVLLDTPAAIRFISAEPLLGPIDLTQIRRQPNDFDRGLAGVETVTEFLLDALDGSTGLRTVQGHEYWSGTPDGITFPHLDWVISGGESGADARPSHPHWFSELRDQCAEADVAYFFKQWGSWGEVLTDWSEIAGSHAEAGRDFVEEHDVFDAATDTLMAVDGRLYTLASLPPGTPAMQMRRMGKKAAGRVLDGVTHDAFPRVRP